MCVRVTVEEKVIYKKVYILDCTDVEADPICDRIENSADSMDDVPCFFENEGIRIIGVNNFDPETKEIECTDLEPV